MLRDKYEQIKSDLVEIMQEQDDEHRYQKMHYCADKH